jgi:hypothetical protein
VVRDAEDPGTQTSLGPVVPAGSVAAEELGERLLADLIGVAVVKPQAPSKPRHHAAVPSIDLEPHRLVADFVERIQQPRRRPCREDWIGP